MVSVTRQATLEALGSSARQLTLDPTVTLSELIQKLRDTEPILFKFRRQDDPASPGGKRKWTRLEIANTVAHVLFGSNERPAGFVSGKIRPWSF